MDCYHFTVFAEREFRAGLPLPDVLGLIDEENDPSGIVRVWEIDLPLIMEEICDDYKEE